MRRWLFWQCICCALVLAARVKVHGQIQPRRNNRNNSENVDSLRNVLIPQDTGRYKPGTRPKVRPRDRQGDPFSNDIQGSPLIYGNPTNIQTKIELDTATNTYTILEKIGDQDYRPVSTMTFEEYSRYKMRENMKAYMKAKSDANGNPAMANGRLVPVIYMNSGLDRLFGSNKVDIQPAGSVILDFGGQSQRTANPALPLRQQRNTQFLFDQQIALNVRGKIGEKLRININYDTKATFEFENQVKVDYTGMDHEILQKIEAGNVSLPISSSLIAGAQNLFGLKTTMQFGRLKVVSVISNQRGKADRLTIKGGATTKDLTIQANEYEANRHYFLSQFFRNNYERALANPTIPGTTSGVIIRRVEVYVTNRANATTGLRNIAAFIDLGDGGPFRPRWQQGGRDSLSPADNQANPLFRELQGDQALRSAENARDRLLGAPYSMTQSQDFEVVRQARKLEAGRDFTFHEALGYISLNSPLQYDEVLGVAFQYTYNGQTYQVGELQNDLGSRQQDEVILLKLLRPAVLNVRLPTWNLMMKNIYSLRNSQIARQGFSMRVIYRDDSSGVDNPVLREGRRIRDRQLVDVLKVDQLNQAGERGSDGLYDFVEGITIDARNGRLMFPVLEPFGNYLRRQFDTPAEDRFIAKYVFDELYRSTPQDALQAANKNKFAIVGKIQSSTSSEITLPGVNISPGSVQVFAGAELLQENVHYTVDYNLGRVRILDQGILASGREVSIRYEKADLFSFQRRTFMGTRLDYTVSKDINIGGTLLYLNETPLIRRQPMGDEPASNVMFGIDGNYRKDSRLLTKLVDKLPFYSTKEVSSVQASAEYARIMPGVSRFVDRTGAGLSYIDDFDGVRTPTTLGTQPSLWKYASAPVRFKTSTGNVLEQNYRRSRLAWYTIDNQFFISSGANRPRNINNEDLRNPYQRPIPFNEIFPNRDANAINLNEPTLDLALYPSERGMYNYNPNLNTDGTLPNPRNNWAGIMRAVTTNTDFDAANIEYLEFWMLDPFANADVGGNTDGTRRRGDLYFDLGVMTEDALEDNLQSFENGLPAPGQNLVTTTPTRWGRVTNSQHITSAFVNTAGARNAQDIGLDGLSDDEEREYFSGTVDPANNFLSAVRPNVSPEVYQELLDDPSADNFTYFLGGQFDNIQTGPKILDRYKKFNGHQGNSPEATGAQAFIPAATQLPDNEDLNGDNTVSNTDSYFSYRVRVTPEEFQAGKNYIVDRIQPGGNNPAWYLFRIPIRDLNHPNFAGRTGDIQDFKTVRFIRAYMTGFEVPTVLRMAQFQMVASTWRPYPKPLTPPRADLNDQDDASLTVGTVNIEENGSVSAGKVPYTVPPGLPRDRDVTSGVNRRLNEQSLALIVNRLRDNDAKAVFKNTKLDFLNYRRLKMWISAYANEPRTRDNEVSAFIRIGTDFTENYYEVEIPQKLIQTGVSGVNPWLDENALDIAIDDLYAAKIRRNRDSIPITMNSPFYTVGNTRQRVSVCGNPDLNTATVVMLGVRNTESSDRRAKSVTVWFNELRVTDFDKNSGDAATARVALKLADLGTVTASTRYVGVGFGSIEQKISERSRTTTLSFQVSGNFNLDKFFPKKLGLRLPMYLSYERDQITPKFDLLNPDLRLSTTLGSFASDDPRRAFYEQIQRDQQTRRSINFTNVGKNKTKQNTIPLPWDIENFNFTYSYTETKRTNINIEDFFTMQYQYGLGYQYTTGAKPLEPFKWIKSNSPALKWLKEFNIAYLPSNITARADLDRRWTKNQLRSANVFLTGDRNPIDPTFEKAFNMNRNFGFQVQPFRSLTVNYTANVQALIDELYDTVGTAADRRRFENRNLRNFGRVKNFNQAVRANYNVPFDKVPILNWIRADLTYAATFNWQANQLAIADTLGNIVQNNRDRQVNTTIDLLKLYNKVPYLQKVNNPAPEPAKPAPKIDPKTGQPVKDTTKKAPELKALKALLRVLMGVRQLNASYQVTEATTLPGYLPTLDLFGYNFAKNQRDFANFILGDQDPSVRFALRDQGLMARSSSLTQPFMQTRQENLTLRTSFEPLRDFRLQLDARAQTNANYSEIFRNVRDLDEVPNFQSQSAARAGSFSMSFISIRTAFDRDDDNSRSRAFRVFEANRDYFRNKLEAGSSRGTTRFDTNAQDVLIPAFLAAYTGQRQDRQNLSPFPAFPMPNWNINYGGLQRIPGLSDIFSTIAINHAYTSTYTIANYTANTNYDLSFFQLANRLSDYNKLRPTLSTNTGRGGDSTWQPVLVINQVVISERFGPLIGINFRTKSKMTFRCDYNRGRDVSMAVSNAQITELNTQDLTFSIGYAKAGMNLPFRSQGRQIVLKNEVQLKCDITLRDTRTTQRQLEQAGQITAGMQDIQIRPTANYVLNQRVNLQLYVEHTRNNPRVSQSFRRVNTRFGFQVRINLM